MLRSTHRTILVRTSFAALLYPGTVLAEVSDKEPTTGLFWAVGITAAILCLFGARLRPWLGGLFFALAALWFASLFLEIHSPDVGPHLRREQGAAYYWQAYASFGIALSGLILGYFWHKRISS